MKNKFYLIGNPVAHSFSPTMQRLFFDYYKIDGEYHALCVQSHQLKSTLHRLKNEGAIGVNVTIPYKEAITPFLNTITDEALAIGCVNTIKFSNGSIEGYNTDYIGFKKSLPLPVEKQQVVLIGAGGAARAILLSLGEMKCRKVSIFNRTFARAELLVQDFQKRYPKTIFQAYPFDPGIAGEIKQAAMLINTSSVGMKSNDPAIALIDPNWLHENLFVYDVVYNPAETPLLQQAKARGLTYCNGLDMLIYQGLESLKIWLGAELPFAMSLISQTREVLLKELTTHG